MSVGAFILEQACVSFIFFSRVWRVFFNLIILLRAGAVARRQARLLWSFYAGALEVKLTSWRLGLYLDCRFLWVCRCAPPGKVYRL